MKKLSYLAALALVAAAAGAGAASTDSLACGVPQPAGQCGNGGGNQTTTAKPGCGYGSHQNHNGPPGHDRVKGNWSSDQRNETTAASRNNAADSQNYNSTTATPQECPATAGGR